MNGKEKKFTRAGDEANRYGALWTMPLVLPLVFFFSDSFYSIAFFFCSVFFSLALSLSLSTGFGPLFFFFFVCVCSLVFLFWSVVQRGRAKGAGILGGKAGARPLAGQCFPLSVSVFPSLTLWSSLPGSYFFLSFCSPVFVRPPFRLLCVSFAPCVLYVPCSCFCSSSGFPLFIPGVLFVFFPFVSFFSWPPPACRGLSLAFIKPENAMRKCLGNGMHCGAEKDVTMICCRFRWIGWRTWIVFLETASFWAGALILQFGHWNYDILQSGPYSWKIPFVFNLAPGSIANKLLYCRNISNTVHGSELFNAVLNWLINI